MAEEDLLPAIEIIHHISLRQKLHCLKLEGPEHGLRVYIELFGLAPILEKTPVHMSHLIERLHDSGTLFIQNVEHLSLETQKQLAGFIAYGYYHKHRCEQRLFAQVRIICSTPKNLAQLVEEGTFSRELYNELRHTSLVMPSLNTLSEQEIQELVQGYAEQWENNDTYAYKSLLSLSEKETNKFLMERPLSFTELKERVHTLLAEKSQRHDLMEVSSFNPAHASFEPDIAYALRLGKKALKDPKLMTLLWDKFKNQNKIALLLGVNRSSVNRRCQLYNLK